jgi:hypothetical protein
LVVGLAGPNRKRRRERDERRGEEGRGGEKGVEEDWNARRTEAEQRAKLEQRAQAGHRKSPGGLGGTAWVGLSARLVGQEKEKKKEVPDVPGPCSTKWTWISIIEVEN